MPSVTVLILTRNEEEILPVCLKHVSWADEILVVDSGSTDRTLEIARQAGARVLSHPFSDFSSQYNFGFENASGDWILYVDADEIVSPRLRDSVLAATSKTDGPEIYSLERDAWVFGHRMRSSSWSHEWLPRLFRKGSVVFHGEVHQEPDIGDRKVERLDGLLYHFTYRSVKQYFEKFAVYSDFWAVKSHARGRTTNIGKALFASIWRFFHNYFIRGEILDGSTGFLLSLLAAQHTFIRHIKLWGLQHSESIRKLESDLL